MYMFSILPHPPISKIWFAKARAPTFDYFGGTIPLILQTSLQRGPLAYKVPGMIDLMLRRLRRREMGTKAPFDSSSERITMTGKRRSEGPGPHDYNPKPESECKHENLEKINTSRKISDFRTPTDHEV
ncbi:unnamed protein product [Hydatigera taeniaeformis]|uniref:Uncharacterized protein n=1 Tax=Hydatigena taeniaeformis TaxID=6205 RepID=A0A0R3XB85_HYDTA|nr:unnamed protein product [Hydatigera taeniaeformis]